MNIDISNHPINLGVRFLLEIGALLAFAWMSFRAGSCTQSAAARTTGSDIPI